MKKAQLVFLAAILMISLVGCSNQKPHVPEEESVDKPAVTERAKATSRPTPTPVPAAKELSFGDTFEFDGFTITLGTEIEWDILDNRFSDLNGADVMKLPMHIVNNSGKTGSLNMFYIKKYGSKGTALDSVGSYFDGEVDRAGDMRSGAEMDTFMAVLYDGDGDYYIEFDNYKEKIEVKLPVVK